MSDQPNAVATSETAQSWKTIHAKHILSHRNKENMEWWLRWPNDIRGPWRPKVSWHLSYKWGKTPKKPHPGNLSRPGIEPGPAAWQAHMLPLAPQRWTIILINEYNFLLFLWIKISGYRGIIINAYYRPWVTSRCGRRLILIDLQYGRLYTVNPALSVTVSNTMR